MSIRNLVRKAIFREKADSSEYISLLRKKGMRIGERVLILNPKAITIDETRPWLIEIGNDVQIANGVCIMTHGYDWSVLKGKYGDVLGSSGKVRIGNNVFLGLNTVILKGVTIGDNVIIGAGSVVTHDIPGNCIASGNPARRIMSLDEYYDKRKKAQYNEASELVREFREVYGKEVEDEDLSEFFWLFTDEDKNLPACWEKKMQLVGTRQKSRKALNKHKPLFKDKESFLKSIQ